MVGFEDERPAVEMQWDRVKCWAEEEGLRLRFVLEGEDAAEGWRVLGRHFPGLDPSDGQVAVAVKGITLPDRTTEMLRRWRRLSAKDDLQAQPTEGREPG